MIPITSDIIGPGIEEEYSDLRPRVEFLLDAWRDHAPGNSTAHGRIVFFMHWLKQELNAERISIPLDRSYLGTIKYLVGSGELGESPPINKAMAQICDILEGRSLIKPRHVAVVVAMIDDFVDQMHRTRPEVTNDPFLLELQQKRNDLVAGRLNLPLDYEKAIDSDQASSKSRCTHPIPEGPLDLDANQAITRILGPFSGRTPYPARKPPMAAPRPGLIPVARGMTLQRNRDRRP